MSLLLTLMELDKLYESNQWLDRKTLINNIKDSGNWSYRFEKYSDKQLYRMWERIQKENEKIAAMQEYNNLRSASIQKPTCEECGANLTDSGGCPMCDDGEEDYR